MHPEVAQSRRTFDALLMPLAIPAPDPEKQRARNHGPF
jgi:hypothetical protein